MSNRRHGPRPLRRRRRKPDVVMAPGPLGGVPLVNLDDAWTRPPCPTVGGGELESLAEAELGEGLGVLASGIKVLPQEHSSPITSQETQRLLYARTRLLGVLGGGHAMAHRPYEPTGVLGSGYL